MTKETIEERKIKLGIVDPIDFVLEKNAIPYLISINVQKNATLECYQEGSGVLIRSRDKFLVLTAAHVLDKLNDETNLFFMVDKIKALIPNVFSGTSKIEDGKTRDDDHIDIGICEISKTTSEELLDAGKRFLDIAAFPDKIQTYESQIGILVGYPNDLNNDLKKRTDIKKNKFKKGGGLGQEPPKLVKQTVSFVNVLFETASDGTLSLTSQEKNKNFRPRKGMSGGGLFRFTIRAPELFGIFIERPEKNQLVYRAVSMSYIKREVIIPFLEYIK